MNEKQQSLDIERQIKNDTFAYLVLQRDNFMCQICGDTSLLTIDHKTPRAIVRSYGDQSEYLNGIVDLRNYWVLCVECHLWKTKTIDFPFGVNVKIKEKSKLRRKVHIGITEKKINPYCLPKESNCLIHPSRDGFNCKKCVRLKRIWLKRWKYRF